MSADTLRVRVARVRDEAPGIRSFELEPDGQGAPPLPPFAAGSHVDVHLPDGLVRPYSLCNDPAESHRYQIAVLRDPASRGGSRAMHEQVREGDVLTIGAPRNHFALARDATHSLLVAGGIGITPILCMAERLARIGAPFALHYCARSRERMAFRQRIGSAAFGVHATLHFDDEPDTAFDLPAVLAAPAPGAHLYVCGPTGFIEAVRRAAREAGWPDAHVHVEFFQGAVAAPADAAATGAAAVDGDGRFRLRLASSGRFIDVPADRTALQALNDAGIAVASSCEQGVCGTCLTRVLDGEPDHRDMYLTPDEQRANDQFLPCCSRSKSPVLVLDL